MSINVDVVVAVVMAIGLVGTVVPVLPGLPVIIVAALGWVLADGADAGQWTVFGIVTVIAVAGMIVGVILPARRATGAGASGGALAVGAVAAIVGAFVIPVVGAFIGWPIGVFMAEWARTRNPAQARASTRATIVGQLHATALQLGAGLAAVGVWAVAAWRW